MLKLIGRVLIVTYLVSSAFQHMQKPAASVTEFKQNYQTFDQLSQQYLNYDIPYDNFQWETAVKIFGLFEALVVLLIIIGDGLGGVLYFLSLFIEIFFLIRPKVTRMHLLTYTEKEQISELVVLVGISLILMCTSSKPKSSK